MATTFIIGAGFSIPAEFPSGHTLNEKFFKNVEKNLLKFSSGEWAWDEYDDIASNNGKLNHDYLNISYLLSELIESFQKDTLLPFDYEEFFDWLNERENSPELLKNCCNQVNKRLRADIPSIHSVHLFNNPDRNEYNRVQNCYVYLIADILKRPYKKEENSYCYNSFIKLLEQDSADLFTLNHDTLVEFLLQKRNLAYSDGFSAVESIIIGDQKIPLPVFNNHYTENIRLYKLHGSIDYYRFQELKQSMGGVYYDTDNYWFFKTDRYWDIHNASKIDSISKEIIQSVNPDIKPQFLTGKSKLSTINNHSVYKFLYNHLRNSLKTADKLIIIGYSYRDIHINELIKNCLAVNNCEIINVNPFVNFPFRRNFSQHNIFNITSLDTIASIKM